MDTNEVLRDQLSRLLDHSEAHTSFDAAVADVSPDVRGVVPAGLPHSLWELLEHLRRAQRDILDFCLEAPYVAQAWPDEYWPPSPEPPSAEAQGEAEKWKAPKPAGLEPKPVDPAPPAAE